MTPILMMVRELGAGGTERQLCEMAKALDRSRFEVHVACFRDQGMRADELHAAGVPIVRVPVRSFYSPSALGAARLLGRYVRDHRIQLVHTFDVPATLFGVPVARYFRVPVVLSSQRAYRSLTPGLTTRLLRLTDRAVDGIVVNCEAMRRHLIDDERVPGDRIHLCYNGVDTAEFHPGPPRGSVTTVGAVCALRPEKGLRTLLEAFAKVSRARLLIVGSGPMLPELQSLSRSLAIDCRFEPATNRVADYMREIDIFVLPSLSEALSNSLIEAMACGCAVIASRVGGNVELVEHDSTGLLFEPGDVGGLAAALARLIEDQALRGKLGSNAAQAIAQRFSLPIASARLAEIYSQFLAKAASFVR